jgi:hypothetical protein
MGAANDNGRAPGTLDMRRRVLQSLLLAAATAAILILARSFR